MSAAPDDVAPRTSARAMPDNSRRKFILLMGARSSGKTSIVDFAFKKTHPTNSLYNASTRKPTPTDFSALEQFQIWDLPGGQFDPDTLNLPLEQLASVIYVVDAQAYSSDAAEVEHKIANSCAKIHAFNPRIGIDVFLHKTDSLSDEYRAELLEMARQRLSDEIDDLPRDMLGEAEDSKPLREMIVFHLTSVFDHTVYEALSRIIQRLLPAQAALEQLLDLMTMNSGMDKAFIFHMPTKLYIATDSSPVDQSTHEMLSDFIDLCVDFSALYECVDQYLTLALRNVDSMTHRPSSAHSDLPSRQPSPMRQTKVLSSNSDGSTGLADSTETLKTRSNQRPIYRTSRVNLVNGVSLAQWQIDDRFSLIALLQPHILDRQGALIEYNVSHFRESVLEVKAVCAS